MKPSSPWRDDQRRTRKGDQSAEDVKGSDAFAGQQAREKDNEQRPEVGDKARLSRGGEAEGAEVERVVAEKPEGAEDVDAQRDSAELGPAFGGRDPDEADGTADGEGHRVELERRDGSGANGEQRQQRPKEDGDEADCGGAFAGHGYPLAGCFGKGKGLRVGGRPAHPPPPSDPEPLASGVPDENGPRNWQGPL